MDQLSRAETPNMLVQNLINGKNDLWIVLCFSILRFLPLIMPAILR
jgi:hypothetical protein